MVFVPTSLTAGQNPLKQFDGLHEVSFLPTAPGTLFQLKCIYRHKRGTLTAADLKNAQHTYQGPPLHFHAHQAERFLVVAGRMGIESNDRQRVVTPADGVVVVPAGTIHRFWAIPRADDVAEATAAVEHVNGSARGSNAHVARSGFTHAALADAHAEEGDDGENVTDLVVLLNATDSGDDYVLDRTFFENWYGMRYDSLMHDGHLDPFQRLCTWDAGDHYAPVPAYLPSFVPNGLSVWIRTAIGYWSTLIIGRYVAPALGYKPFFKEYTTDWPYAQARMKASWMHARNVHTSWTLRRGFEELHGLSVATNAAVEAMGGAVERMRGRFGQFDTIFTQQARAAGGHGKKDV